ncbi:MAG: DUF447 family protein [Gammaproteobacteria bacterium]|nr:DUF447 family protein [Gammaproteobacteria bacterium]
MICEAILTTRDRAGRAHVAPMGFREEDGLVRLAPFRPSTTLDNLQAVGTAVLNLTDDVRVFAGCLTGRRDWPTVPAERVPGVRLERTLAHRELEVTRVEDDEVRPAVYCRERHAVVHAPFRGFNRAQAAVIEAAILVSRLHLLPREKIEREIEYLTIAVEKTAGPREQEAWQWLMEAVARHHAAPEAGA